MRRLVLLISLTALSSLVLSVPARAATVETMRPTVGTRETSENLVGGHVRHGGST